MENIKYNKNCGLSKNEFELQKIVDCIKKETSTLKCIIILKNLQATRTKESV